MQNLNHLDHLLDRYVSTDELRPRLCTPTLENNYVFASDAHQMICIPPKLLSGDYSTHVGPYFSKVMPGPERFRKTPIGIDIDYMAKSLSAREKKPIYEQLECSTCDASGMVTCSHCKVDSQCSDCDGEGFVNGKQIGESFNKLYLTIGSMYVRPDYIENAIYVAQTIGQPLQWLTKDDGFYAIMLGCGEVQIMIMPLGPPFRENWGVEKIKLLQ